MTDSLGEESALYPMRVVTQLTGLNAETIRSWQRRYNAITPHRSAGNARRFTLADVKRLNLIREATFLGHTISAIANLKTDDLERLVERGSDGMDSRAEVSLSWDAVRNDYLRAIASFDMRSATRMLSVASARIPSRDFLLELVLPILRQVGESWHDGRLSVAHEHLVTTHIKGILANMLINSTFNPGARRIITCSPEGHLHEFGILAAALLGARRGIDVLNLGPNLPFSDLIRTVEAAKPDLVFMSVARTVEPHELELLEANLRDLRSYTKVWLGISQNSGSESLVDAVDCTFDDYERFDFALANFAKQG